MFGNLSRADRRLQIECQLAAAMTRQMWLNMKRTGHGWSWDCYRGWIQDSRDIRLGKKWACHGPKGLRKPVTRLRHAFTVLN